MAKEISWLTRDPRVAAIVFPKVDLRREGLSKRRHPGPAPHWFGQIFSGVLTNRRMMDRLSQLTIANWGGVPWVEAPARFSALTMRWSSLQGAQPCGFWLTLGQKALRDPSGLPLAVEPGGTYVTEHSESSKSVTSDCRSEQQNTYVQCLWSQVICHKLN